MISKRELEQLRAEWSLDIGVIEKDYILGWLLAGIAQHSELASSWVFKGGTCLRKCFYETFRFSVRIPEFSNRRFQGVSATSSASFSSGII